MFTASFCSTEGAPHSTQSALDCVCTCPAGPIHTGSCIRLVFNKDHGSRVQSHAADRCTGFQIDSSHTSRAEPGPSLDYITVTSAVASALSFQGRDYLQKRMRVLFFFLSKGLCGDVHRKFKRGFEFVSS